MIQMSVSGTSVTFHTIIGVVLVNLGGVGPTADWTTVDVSAYVPVGAVAAYITGWTFEGSTDVYRLSFRKTGSAQTQSQGGASEVNLANTSNQRYFQYLVELDSNRTFQYFLQRQAGASTLDSGQIAIVGYMA